METVGNGEDSGEPQSMSSCHHEGIAPRVARSCEFERGTSSLDFFMLKCPKFKKSSLKKLIYGTNKT